MSTLLSRVLLLLGGVVGAILATSKLRVVEVVGTLTLAVLGVKIAWVLFEKATRRQKLAREYGKWAIVTGATTAIGEAFAHELAARAMSLMLVGRAQDKLDILKKTIKSRSPDVEVEVMAFDFGRSGEDVEASYAELQKVAERLDREGGIGLFVNSAGLNSDVPEYLHMVPEKSLLDLVRSNVEGTVRTTRIILPLMVNKGSGGIVNVSSASGSHPTPLMATSAACKAFMTNFSQSIYHEAREAGVRVLAVTPYHVTTSSVKKEQSRRLCSPESVVLKALALLGRYDTAYPHLTHTLQGLLWRFYWATPQALMKVLKKQREKALEKRKGSPTSTATANEPAR